MSVLLVAALGLSGCALHASLHPPIFEFAYGYGRVTDCPGQPIPPQLIPILARLNYVMVDGDPAPCRTVEVGAMHWENMISAVGAALIAIIPLL